MEKKMMKNKMVLMFLLVLFSNTLIAQGSGGNFRDTTQLSRFIDSLYANNSFSGIVTIAKGNTIVYKRIKGYSDKVLRIPISEHTIFNVGSATKMFTGVAVMQLVERNKVKLSDPVSYYLPDYLNKEWSGKATIQNLLTHTSGLGDFFPHGHTFKNLYDLGEIVDFIAKTVTANSPSDEMNYSNAGFYLLGRIIEKVSGENYFTYMQKNIFDKAGMKNTFFKVIEEDKRFAKGYMENEKRNQFETNEKVINRIGGPAGGALTTVSDLLAFQHALKNNVLISDATFKNMSQAKVSVRGGMGYGLGIGAGILNGVKWVGHNGGGPGIAANYAWYPDSDYSIVVLLNQDADSNMPLMFRSKLFVSGME